MHKKEIKRFAKLLHYVLGIRPDEFGLIPEPEGFVKAKDLLQALKEEEEWTFLRRGHLLALMHSPDGHLFEWMDDQIRLRRIRANLVPEPAQSPPSPLYHAVRPRAHPVLFRRGLRPNKGRWVVMSHSREMALRIGMRLCPEPVILEVRAQEAAQSGIRFYETQGLLTLAEFIPHEFIKGPPPSLEKEKIPLKKSPRGEPSEAPGSILLDQERLLQSDWEISGIKRGAAWRREQKRRRQREKKRSKR